jgi:uncharacterized Fe-S center protein
MSVLPFLICMQRGRMMVTHPDMIEGECRDCGAVVGIYPSGQKILREQANVQIVCDVCYAARYSDLPTIEAPGAIEEAKQLWRKRKPQ